MAVSGLSVLNDVKLIVKTPNQRIGDVHVSCEIGWTVQRLKEHLSSVYPTKPCKTIQRLIYAGRLLQDHLTLTDILSKDNDSHTVHIVCSVSGNEIEISADDASPSQATATGGSSHNVTAMPTNTNATSHTGNNGSVRSRFPATNSSPMLNMTPNMQSTTTPVDQTQANQQWQQYMQSMQQYWNAYYQQQQQMAAMYHQNTNPSFFGPMSFTPLFNNATFTTPPMMPQVPTGPIPDLTNNGAHQPSELNQQPAPNAQPQVEQQQQPEVRQPAPAAAAPQNLPRLNAGGAMFDDDEEEEGGGRQRDWLDWIYTFLRCGVLLSVMYFYSSASRLVLVLLLGFIVYLYQNGWFSLPQRQQPQQQQQGQENPFPGQDENENQGHDDDNNNNDEIPPQEQQNVNGGTNLIANTTSTISLLFTFVSSFFTSLIPQRPPPIQL